MNLRRMWCRAGAAVVCGAALVLVPAAGPAAAANQSVCNTYCDGRDPALAPGERVPVQATLSGRTIRLHVDDTDAMGWASIDGGTGGDEVWLDRSYDGGQSWSTGSKLGDTSTPSGASGWRTLMYNVDDWNDAGVGALRACGQATGSTAIACTPWARSDWNAWSRSTAAATGLMMMYDRDTGLFGGNGWWTSANALTAIIDNARVSGMPSYEYAISETYDKNLGAQGGNFTNDYVDDTGWWGLAWLDAYDLTGDARYLTTARADADDMARYWTDLCGGGVLWNTGNTGYKNAIANELYLELNAALHNRIAGDTTYLARARQEWAWFAGTGMINSSHLVNDGLDGSCHNDGHPTYTYNQGVILGGLAELYRATGDGAVLDTARTLADASTGSTTLNPGGTLRDENEADSCSGDGPSFKGAYVRGLGLLDSVLSDHPYAGYLHRQADTAYANDRDPLDLYGPHWAGDGRGPTGHGCQHSALDLLNATS
jgi:hypothetical protein